jgi:hypothetical protein
MASDELLRGLDETDVRDLTPGPARAQISSGDVFHCWTVVAESEKRRGQRAYLCRCRCGTERAVLASKLKTGWSKSCGCLKKANASQRFRKPVKTGDVFHRLTAVAPSYRRATGSSSQEYVRCRCDCGAEKDYCVSHLRSGKIKSCGCFKKEAAKSRGIQIMPGDVFGQYTVLEQDSPPAGDKKPRRRYLCRCQCGNIRSVLGFSLANGSIKSCGCLRKLKAGTYGLTPEMRRDRAASLSRQYYAETRERRRELRREYRQANKSKINASRVAHERKKQANDPGYRVLVTLRKRVSKTLRKKGASVSAVRDLGCSLDDFRRYLEKQFQAGWTWENYGTAWHIDHIYPLSFVDFQDPIEARAACNWRNLRPLAAGDNLSKNNALSAKAQYLFNKIKEIVGRSNAPAGDATNDSG